MGENHFATWPVAVYGIVLFMAGLAYYFLAHCLAGLQGKDSTLALAIGKDKKGLLSVVIYALGVGLSFVHSGLGFSCYLLVAAIWFIPDRRMERKVNGEL